MEDNQPLEMILPPREAAMQLGVAPSTLRRLATVYADVYGPAALGWSDGGKGGGSRLWTTTALRQTRAARDLVESGRAASFELALRMLKDVPESTLAAMSADPAPIPDVQALLERFAALEAKVERMDALEAELEALREEVAQLRALPPAAPAERVEEPSQTSVPEGRAEPERPSEQPETQRTPLPSASAERIDRALEVEMQQPEPPEQPIGDGPMVRAARWLEKLLRR